MSYHLRKPNQICALFKVKNKVKYEYTYKITLYKNI